MNNGIYSAATGMLSQGRALDVTASNLANINTAGYKRDRMIISTFGEQTVNRIEGGKTEIGTHTHGATASEIVADPSQGVLEVTGRTLDFAILGEGYFSVETAAGEPAVTRDGRFHIDAEGYLRTASDGYVLGEGGRIQLPGGEITVGEGGALLSGGQQVGQLAITVPDAETAYTKLSDNSMAQPDGAGTFEGRVVQGQLERSNVDMVEEMANMMEASRAFQSCAQAIKILDAASQKTVNEIGRL
jgi:flagellar basal-body rod protein FlgG